MPIRIRLTAGFTAVMAVVLALIGVFVYLRVQSDLDASLDRSLRSRADDVAALVESGGSGLAAGAARLTEADESFAQLVGPDGQVLDGSAPFDSTSVLTPSQLRAARQEPVIVDSDSLPQEDDAMRVLARPAGGEGAVVVVGSSLEDRDEALEALGSVLLVGGPLALLLAALAGYGLTGAALRPVVRMREQAETISRLGSGRRLPVAPARDELHGLGETLNQMLDRLERSAERERGFVASASHELRTPLALMKGELELALREGRSPDELRAALRSAAEETDRMARLSEDLLVLARADEGRLPVRPEPLALDELLESTARRFAARAREEGRELRVADAGGVRVEADRLRLEQALANLVDNALRYGEGTVELGAASENGAVTLRVRDHGPGFPPELADHAFERFTRADRARSRGGTGLGLAIVDAVARAHGGRTGVSGSEVWIELPGEAAVSPARRPPPPA